VTRTPHDCDDRRRFDVFERSRKARCERRGRLVPEGEGWFVVK